MGRVGNGLISSHIFFMPSVSHWGDLPSPADTEIDRKSLQGEENALSGTSVPIKRFPPIPVLMTTQSLG